MKLDNINNKILVSSAYSTQERLGMLKNKKDNEGPAFKDIVSDKLNKVNNKQILADNMTIGFITGEVDDLHDVMIATEEAKLSLELAVQVRNKLVEGFKEINNIQL